jgi:hypothetical protein
LTTASPNARLAKEAAAKQQVREAEKEEREDISKK